MPRASGRVEAFSDGVLAIVATLLVLELRVPILQSALSRHEALGALRLLLPKFGSFVLSFTYIAIFWVNHHHFFDLIVEVDPGLIWLNNLLLLFLCFIPFPTGMIGGYPANPVALALFAVILMGAGLVFTGMWAYAYRRKLMKSSVRREVSQYSVQNRLCGQQLYAVAIAGAFAVPWTAWAVFVAVPVFFFLHSMRTPWNE